MGRLLLLSIGIGFRFGIVFHICFVPGPFDTDSDSDPDSELLECLEVCSFIIRNEILNHAIESGIDLPGVEAGLQNAGRQPVSD